MPSPAPTPTRRPTTHGAPVDGALRWLRFERSPNHRRPAASALMAATVVALVGSLLADWLLAKLGVAVFPGTRGYQHFQFGDYATLTVLGVLAACVGWPLVIRLCRSPRWLFLRLAVLVSAILLLPDLYIWAAQGQPGKAVLFLALMHIAIGVVTYNALTRLAPVRARLRSE